MVGLQFPLEGAVEDGGQQRVQLGGGFGLQPLQCVCHSAQRSKSLAREVVLHGSIRNQDVQSCKLAGSKQKLLRLGNHIENHEVLIKVSCKWRIITSSLISSGRSRTCFVVHIVRLNTSASCSPIGLEHTRDELSTPFRHKRFFWIWSRAATNYHSHSSAVENRTRAASSAAAVAAVLFCL